MKKRSYLHIKLLLLAATMVVLIAAASGAFMQKKMLDKKNAEHAELVREQDELELERNRMRLLSQYVGTQDYAEYYARYRLGYVYPDEIVFER